MLRSGRITINHSPTQNLGEVPEDRTVLSPLFPKIEGDDVERVATSSSSLTNSPQSRELGILGRTLRQGHGARSLQTQLSGFPIVGITCEVEKGRATRHDHLVDRSLRRDTNNALSGAKRPKETVGASSIFQGIMNSHVLRNLLGAAQHAVGKLTRGATDYTEEGVNKILRQQLDDLNHNGFHHTVNSAVCRGYLTHMLSKVENMKDLQSKLSLGEGGALPANDAKVNLHEWICFLCMHRMPTKVADANDRNELVPFTRVLALFPQSQGTKFINVDKYIRSKQFPSFDITTKSDLFYSQAIFHYSQMIENMIKASKDSGQTYEEPNTETIQEFAGKFVEMYINHFSEEDIKYIHDSFENKREGLDQIVASGNQENLEQQECFLPFDSSRKSNFVAFDCRPKFVQYILFIDNILKDKMPKPHV